VSPVKYELGFYIPEDDILHSDRRESLKSYTINFVLGTDVAAGNNQTKTSCDNIACFAVSCRYRRLL
jgi:hypothetical protein